MPKLAGIRSEVLNDLRNKVRAAIGEASTVEVAAERAVAAIYDDLRESLVLLRMYAALPFKSAPTDVQKFVQALPRPGDAPIAPNTPVLTLLATRGREPAWNERRKSKGHVGIPLSNPEAVASIPMVAQMMSDLGLALQLTPKGSEAQIVEVLSASNAGMFFVDDARSARDARGRLVVPAQDFVAKHGVRTVFGVGGKYLAGNEFIALIAFSNESLARTDVEPFGAFAHVLKAGTVRLVMRGELFA